MITKECFGQLANLSIRYNNRNQRHFLRVDEEKFKECDECPLFTKCMFLRYNEIIRDILRMMDESGAKDSRPKL